MGAQEFNRIGEEVDCDACVPFMEEVAKKGGTPEDLASGTGYSVEHLGRARERISWQAYCTFAQNIRRFWADEELFEFGTQTLGHPAARNIRHFAEFLVDAIDLYRLAVRVARWNISCIEVLLLEIDPRNLRMTFRMLPGYQPCEGYFLVTRGVVAAIPELIGLPRAEVTRSDHGSLVYFDIRVTPSKKLLHTLRRRVRAAGRPRSKNLEVEARYAQLQYESQKQMLLRTAELKEAYQALEEKNQEIIEAQTQLVQAEKMAALGQLVAGVAHEINNPINFIIAALPSIDRDLEKALAMVPEQGRGAEYEKIQKRLGKLLGAISEGAERTSGIVRDLRAFTRLGTQEVGTADLHEALDATLALLQHQIGERIEIVKIYGEIPPIECSIGQINQVFMNLLVNAVHAIVGEGTIIVTTKSADGFIRVSVQDTGEGIPAGVRDKIFDPFFTTKDVGEGTGLGLSISHGIVEKHGGTIEIAETSSEGTEMVVTLPISFKN